MTATKGTVWLVSVVVLFALVYSAYEHREATKRSKEAATLTRERNGLQERLEWLEQRAAKSDQRATQAERQVGELERELRGLLAAKSGPAAEVPSFRSQEEIDNDPALLAEKMARMKPLLEGGMPIKGVAVLSVNGMPVNQAVAFVIGKTTELDLCDDGTYA